MKHSNIGIQIDNEVDKKHLMIIRTYDECAFYWKILHCSQIQDELCERHLHM